MKGEPDLNVALRLPGALQAEARSTGEEDLAALTESAMREIGPLLAELRNMRAREGEALEANLRACLDRLAEAVEGVATLRPEVEQRYQERLTQRLIAATGNEFNRQRLLEEVAVLVDHSDVSEELERMHTHIGHFRELLTAGGEVGQEARFSAAGDESRSQHAAFKDRRRWREGNTHYRTWAGHESGYREGPRADSKRGVKI